MQGGFVGGVGQPTGVGDERFEFVEGEAMVAAVARGERSQIVLCGPGPFPGVRLPLERGKLLEERDGHEGLLLGGELALGKVGHRRRRGHGRGGSQGRRQGTRGDLDQVF